MARRWSFHIFRVRRWEGRYGQVTCNRREGDFQAESQRITTVLPPADWTLIAALSGGRP